MRYLSGKPELRRNVKAAAAALHFSSAIICKEREAVQSCLSLLHDCDSTPNLSQLHNLIIKSGFKNNLLVLTKFTSACSNLNALDDYALPFLFSPDADCSSYDAFLFNTIIRPYAQSADTKTMAINYFKLMLDYGVKPDHFTFPIVLKACAGIGQLNLGMQVHGSVLKLGFDHDLHVSNTIIHMYFCCGREVKLACKVFDGMPKPDFVTWSAMISGYARLGMSVEAVELFRKMQISSVRPDEVTMISVVSACTDLGSLEIGKWVELYIEKEKISTSVELCNALICMFSKLGDLDRALKLFRSMNERTIESWTSVISAMANNGGGLEAISLFNEMKESGIAPDDIAFVGLLTACSHSGLVEEGKNWFDSMKRVYSIEPKIQHYGCMVDMLCRGGFVEEAYWFVKKMPIKANPIIWRTLITACQVHGKFRLGESITEQLITSEPMNESNYVLISSIYVKMMCWEKNSLIREFMNMNGMRKVPGSTMIEIDN